MKYRRTANGTMVPVFESHQDRYAYRKLNELCVECGRELDESRDAFTCARCGKRSGRRQARYRRSHPEQVAKNLVRVAASRAAKPTLHRRQRLRLYRKKRERGTCVDCTQLAEPGHVECIVHLEANRLSSRRNWRKRHGKLGMVAAAIVEEIMCAVVRDGWERAV